MMTVKAMTIIVDSLLLRLKLDYDGAYDMAVKGLDIVVTLGMFPNSSTPQMAGWGGIYSLTI